MPIALETGGLEEPFDGTVATNHVSLAIERGSRCALIGPNGAGKTTLINLLTGVLQPSGGRIMLDGQDIADLKPHERVRLGLARTFQINQLFGDMTPIETVGLAVSERIGAGGDWWRLVGRKPHVVEDMVDLLERFHLTDVMYERTATLPYGKQRLL